MRIDFLILQQQMDSEEDSFQTYHPIYFTDNQNSHYCLLFRSYELLFINLTNWFIVIYKHLQDTNKAKQQNKIQTRTNATYIN